MPHSYAFLADAAAELDVPENGILSRTVHQDDHAKIVLFGFSDGQELSAHTAPMPATLHFLKGSARVRLGDDTVEAKAGSFVYMPPLLEHGIVATAPLVMLLVLHKQPRQPAT